MTTLSFKLDRYQHSVYRHEPAVDSSTAGRAKPELLAEDSGHFWPNWADSVHCLACPRQKPRNLSLGHRANLLLRRLSHRYELYSDLQFRRSRSRRRRLNLRLWPSHLPKHEVRWKSVVIVRKFLKEDEHFQFDVATTEQDVPGIQSGHRSCKNLCHLSESSR